MNKLILLNLIIIFSFSANANNHQGLIHFPSDYSVTETTNNLKKILLEKQFTIFNQIDHGKAANQNGVALNDTQLIIFGNPKIGSQLMKCNQTVAIDLPQKALIWKDREDNVWLSINDPEYLYQRHQLNDCKPLTLKIKNALTHIAKQATDREKLK